MKTASKRLSFFGLALLASLAGLPAHAADAGLVPPPSLPVSGASPALMPLPDADEKGVKGLSNAEDKAIDQAKGVIHHLNGTDNMTLDDLNSAHQAIAKIDALIDLEKHLNELEKLRNEREGGGKFAAAIPASSLRPATLALPTQSMSGPAVLPVSMGGGEVVRVIGTDGHYSAVIKAADGGMRNVQVGDHVPELGTVIAVNSMGVEVEQNHVRRTIKMKNVHTVFGSTP